MQCACTAKHSKPKILQLTKSVGTYTNKAFTFAAYSITMNHKFCLTVSLLLAFTFANAQQTFTLQQSIDYALQNAPSFQNYKIDRQIASARNFESITKYLPKVNGVAEYRNNLNLAVNQIPAEFFGGQPGDFREIRFGVKHNATAGLDFNQSILDAAAIGDILYTKQGKVLSEYQIQQATIELKVNVTKAYYTTQLNTQKLEKATKAVERNKKVHDDTKVKLQNQNATKTDVNRAYLSWQQSLYQAQLANDALRQSKLLLMQTIGMAFNENLEIAESLPLNFNADTVVQLAEAHTIFASRIEYKAEQQQTLLNKWLLRKTNLQYAPNVSFFGYIGGQGFSNNSNVFTEKWNQVSYIGVRLNMPIFDGLQKATIAQQQKLNLKKNQNNLRNIEQTVNYQLQSTALSFANAARNVKVQQQNIALAEEILHDVKVRYQNAFAIYQEVIDAENMLKDAEVLYFTALFDYLVAEVDWKKANGKM